MGGTRARWQRWWPFALLVLAGASRWMLEGVQPETASTLASEALGCAWAALVSLVWVSQPSSRRLLHGPLDWRAMLAGALLLGGPASALLVGGSGLDAPSIPMALALTPVAVAIAAATFGIAGKDGVPGRIWPGLAAVAGLLLVLAQPSLGDARSDVAMLLAPILAGVGAALFCADSPTPGMLSVQAPAARITAALAGGAVLFAFAVAAQGWITGVRPVVALPAVACDGLIALLGVLVLARLGATRWSAQFVILPLLILLEGIVLARPGLTARLLAGLGLLALASAYLLLPPVDETEERPAFVPR